MTRDRRRHARQETLGNAGRLEWAERGNYREARITLHDISRGGARIVAECTPLRDRRSWIRLEKPAPTGWISVNVIRLGESLEAGLVFSDECPFDFLLAATLGIGFDFVGSLHNNGPSL
ncbi:MAG: hypothetical protein Q9211_007187 [Gyalolechia sp. 1 TL-2023]